MTVWSRFILWMVLWHAVIKGLLAGFVLISLALMLFFLPFSIVGSSEEPNPSALKSRKSFPHNSLGQAVLGGTKRGRNRSRISPSTRFCVFVQGCPVPRWINTCSGNRL